MATNCSNPIGGFTAAWEVVPDQFEWFTEIANGYILAANEFTQELANYNIVPLDFQPVNFEEYEGYTPYEKPEDPADFVPPDPQFTGSEPDAPQAGPIDTSGLDVAAPTDTLPSAPPIQIPPPPIVSLPEVPDTPVLDDVDVPLYEGGPLPDVPTLYELDLPDPPTINIDDLEIDRPQFIAPDALEDTYRPDWVDFHNVIYTGVNATLDETGVTDMYARLQAMLAGGTGLPANIEQALFDRAIGRDEVSSRQAVAQAEQEWAAKGFDLPGSTLLARVQEIRQANRTERGRINRELSIQFHTQEIENLRFSVDKAIVLEGTLLNAYTQIYDLARQLADGHWVVVKGIYDSTLDLFRLQLEIYRTDAEVYKLGLEAELVKLEIYRSELEAQRIIGQLNQQLVDIYVAELRAVQTSVDIYRAQVDAANSQISAELAKVNLFQAQIDAYTATINGERAKFDMYNSQVDAERTKAQVYTAQVDAYGRRIEAYRTEVQAESAKVGAEVDVVEAQTRIYSEEVSAWRTGIAADTANLQAFVEVYRANLAKYNALLSAEQYRVTGEARNWEISLEEERSRVQAQLKQADQSIAQLEHITSLGLSATETAARVNAQLASSAMSAINVGANMSSSNSVSASDSRSCSTSYSGIL